MATTGIGYDIVPRNSREVTFTMALVVVGLLLYAVIIGSAASALSNMDAPSVRRRKRIDTINSFLREHKVPPFFQRILHSYFAHTETNPMTSDTVLNDLPPTLRFRLLLLLHHDLIAAVPVFQELSAPHFVRLVQKLIPVTYIPGEFIVDEGDRGDHMFVVRRGAVDIIKEPNSAYPCLRPSLERCAPLTAEVAHPHGPSRAVVVATLKPGGFFGEEALLNEDSLRLASARAVGFADVLALGRVDFEAIAASEASFKARIAKAVEERTKSIEEVTKARRLLGGGDAHAADGVRRPGVMHTTWTASGGPVTSAMPSLSAAGLGGPRSTPPVQARLQEAKHPLSPTTDAFEAEVKQMLLAEDAIGRRARSPTRRRGHKLSPIRERAARSRNAVHPSGRAALSPTTAASPGARSPHTGDSRVSVASDITRRVGSMLPALRPGAASKTPQSLPRMERWTTEDSEVVRLLEMRSGITPTSASTAQTSESPGVDGRGAAQNSGGESPMAALADVKDPIKAYLRDVLTHQHAMLGHALHDAVTDAQGAGADVPTSPGLLHRVLQAGTGALPAADMHKLQEKYGGNSFESGSTAGDRSSAPGTPGVYARESSVSIAAKTPAGAAGGGGASTVVPMSGGDAKQTDEPPVG